MWSCVTQRVEYGLFCSVYSLIALDCTLIEATIKHYTLYYLSLFTSSCAKGGYKVCEKLDMLVVLKLLKHTSSAIV